VDWLRRITRHPPDDAAAPVEPLPQPVERSSPGVAAVLDRVSEDRSHAVLDLGPAADSSLRVYSRFARWVRFADLLAGPAPQGGWAAALDAVPSHAERPYDLIFAWNVLDRLDPDDRPLLVKRLTEIAAPDARLYVVVEATELGESHPLRFALLDVDRMRYEPTGPSRPTWPQLRPAEVERLLLPFKVTRAFTSKVGLREYVAMRQ
jgi:hypothetical protein